MPSGLASFLTVFLVFSIFFSSSVYGVPPWIYDPYPPPPWGSNETRGNWSENITFVNYTYAGEIGECYVAVSLSDLGIVSQELDVYRISSRVSYVGVFSSDSTLLLDCNSSYYFVFKPRPAKVWENPRTTMDWLLSMVPVLFSVLIVLAIGGGFVLVLRRGLR